MPGVVLLNGSPHRDGNTMLLARELLSVIPGGYTLIHAYDSAVTSCMDCGGCREKPECSIKDGMDELYPLLRQCSVIVIASPMHFGGLSAPLAAVISRLQLYWQAGKRGENAGMRGKKGVLLLTGGAAFPNQFQAAEKQGKLALRQLRAEVTGKLAVGGTDNLSISQNESAREEARSLGKPLAEYMKCFAAEKRLGL